MTTETAFVLLAVILVLFLAASTAKAASDKGCSATVWFIAGVLLPGLALVVALFLDEQSVKECPRCVRRIDPWRSHLWLLRARLHRSQAIARG
jgi:hypothetical protein